MNSTDWLHYFEQNRRNRPEPPWHVPSPLSAHAQEILRRSLSHFQLGESGEGSFLLQQAREQVPDDPDYATALALFVDEEKEHARLLERVIRRFGGEPLRRHWTHRLFRLARRAFGLKFEIQVLVIAELVGTAYYQLLKLRTTDPVLDAVCDLLLRDETRHVQFQAEWLSQLQARWLPAECQAWSLQFQLLFTAATNVAWFDHREALKAAGANKREFFRAARGECISFLKQLECREARNAIWKAALT